MLLGDKGMSITGLRFSAKMLSSTHVRELYDQGMTMERIAAGASVVPMADIAPMAELKEQLESVSTSLRESVGTSSQNSEFLLSAYLADNRHSRPHPPLTNGTIPVLAPLTDRADAMLSSLRYAAFVAEGY